MLPLFDMLNNAQNGQAMAQFARQFNISQQQAQLAVEALLPAFSQGLKRNASDPYGIGAFMQALSTGQHARYFENAQAAFSPSGVDEGNAILGHLFGSKDLSRAVAAQAAQATGLGQEMLKQMLPALAAMLMGGIFKQASGQMQDTRTSGATRTGNPFADMFGEFLRQAGGGAATPQQPANPQASNPFENPFGKMLEGMLGGGASQQPRQQAPQNPFGENPFGKMFEDMLAGAGRAQPEPEPERAANPSGRPRNPYDDFFGEMFETGARTRDDYQKSMESVFDQFLQGMERHRR